MLKKTVFLTAGMVLSAGAANAQLIISEVMDGPLTGGIPKYIEITNVSGSAVDLSNYDLAKVANGPTVVGEYEFATQLSGTLDPGESFVIASEDVEFQNAFGFLPDLVDIQANNNGDDTVGIIATGDLVIANSIDVYGDGDDGTGDPWEYLDTRVVRKPSVTAGTATFDVSEWYVNPIDDLDGKDATAVGLIGTPGAHIFGSQTDQIGTGGLGSPTPALNVAVSASDILNGLTPTEGGIGLHPAATGGLGVFTDGSDNAANNLDGLLDDAAGSAQVSTLFYDLGGQFDLTGLNIYTQNTGADARIFLNARISVDTTDDGAADTVVGEVILGGPGAIVSGGETWGELNLTANLGEGVYGVEFAFFSVTNTALEYRGPGNGQGGSLVKEIDLLGSATSTVTDWQLLD